MKLWKDIVKELTEIAIAVFYEIDRAGDWCSMTGEYMDGFEEIQTDSAGSHMNLLLKKKKFIILILRDVDLRWKGGWVKVELRLS